MSGDSVTSTVRVFMAFARGGRLVLNASTDLPDGMVALMLVDDLLAMPVDDPSAKDSEVADVAKRRTKSVEAEADRAVQRAARRRVTREAAQKGPKT